MLIHLKKFAKMVNLLKQKINKINFFSLVLEGTQFCLISINVWVIFKKILVSYRPTIYSHTEIYLITSPCGVAS